MSRTRFSQVLIGLVNAGLVVAASTLVEPVFVYREPHF